MRVPADVPPDVPATAPTGVAADVTADAPTRRGRGRAGKIRRRNDGNSPYLIGTPAGWRFQMRMPTVLLGDDSRVAGVGSTIRASIGSRGRGEAKRLARLLATICETVFAMATAKKETDTMTTHQSPDDNGNKLVEQVIDACQNAIKQAVAQPSRAIGLAQGLGSALTALQLVQTEVGRDQHGAGAVAKHADVLARGALKDVLAHACVYRKLDSAIMVVKAAEDRLRCNGAETLNRAMERGVLVQRSMSPQLIIIGGICARDSAQVCFTEHDHVVQALPADRADESFNIGILPR